MCKPSGICKRIGLGEWILHYSYRESTESPRVSVLFLLIKNSCHMHYWTFHFFSVVLFPVACAKSLNLHPLKCGHLSSLFKPFILGWATPAGRHRRQRHHCSWASPQRGDDLTAQPAHHTPFLPLPASTNPSSEVMTSRCETRGRKTHTLTLTHKQKSVTICKAWVGGRGNEPMRTKKASQANCVFAFCMILISLVLLHFSFTKKSTPDTWTELLLFTRD